MKLLELLCEELPKRGGWPQWAAAAVQFKNGQVSYAGKGYKLYYANAWTSSVPGGSWGENASRDLKDGFLCHTIASDHATRIVTREEYEAAVTPRVIPRRSDVLASLVGNLKQWPTEITDDLPHFIGWAWEVTNNTGEVCLFTDDLNDEYIDEGCWQAVKIRNAQRDATLQPQPTPHGSGDPVLGMVLTDLTNRALAGKEKYGEPLKAHNGRNALQDAYEEALDMCMYLRQALEEQRNA
ncbi:MAG: hypothetical protein ACRC8W_04240 [Plesiomonas shigelloides]